MMRIQFQRTDFRSRIWRSDTLSKIAAGEEKLTFLGKNLALIVCAISGSIVDGFALFPECESG